MRPNDYTRADVLKVARIINPKAWITVPVGQEPPVNQLWYTPIADSISAAANVLYANFRDCTI